MIDTSEILTQADQYAFSLLDINLIDFDNINFDNDDVISLPLITSKVPVLTDNLDDDTCLFINDAILDGEMWFTYNPLDHIIEALIIEHMCIQQQILCDSTIYFMEQASHPEYNRYKQCYDKFIFDIKDRLKQQLRSIMSEVKGEFVKDKFIKDTYFQGRQQGDKGIYYVVYRWWEKLCEGEIEFIDIVNGDGTVYVARND